MPMIDTDSDWMRQRDAQAGSLQPIDYRRIHKRWRGIEDRHAGRVGIHVDSGCGSHVGIRIDDGCEISVGIRCNSGYTRRIAFYPVSGSPAANLKNDRCHSQED